VSYIAAEHPVEAIGPARLDMLRALPDLAIGAIAGRDSVAAVVAAVREGGFSAIMPTSVATGTEYGDTDAPLAAVAQLRRILGEEADVLDPVRIGSPRLWAAMNGRFAGEIAERWDVCSPCLACHLYVHLARVPMSWALGQAPVITGERDTHDGRMKVSQTTASIDAETRVLARAGVDLLTPVRTLPTAQVIDLVDGWTEDGRGLTCVHSSNYVRLDGSVSLDADGYARYLREFFEPVGFAVVDAWREGDSEPDYQAIVREVLERS
jgi:hypothetical protein